MKKLNNFIVKNDKNISVILLQSPPVNIITEDLLRELDYIFEELLKEKDLRAIVISSNNSNLFSAGADIKQFQSWTGKTGKEACWFGSKVYRKIEMFYKPVICAVNGNAFGGAVELTLACDIRVFDERAKVALPECGLGMQPGYGGTQRLVKLTHPGFAKKMLMIGGQVTAQEAYNVGLADVITPAGESLNEAVRMAKAISSKSPIAISQIKKSVAFSIENTIDDGLEFENKGIELLCDTEDKSEGAKAFIEKRKPYFHGK